MDTVTIPQPLDTLMNQHGVSNADLVKALPQQLSFKMVRKGRKGRRLTPNIQDKILNAFIKVKPELKLCRRDLFPYDTPAHPVPEPAATPPAPPAAPKGKAEKTDPGLKTSIKARKRKQQLKLHRVKRKKSLERKKSGVFRKS